MITYTHWTDITTSDFEYWKERWPNFTPQEMACRGSGMLVVSIEFMDALQNLRNDLNKVIHVISGCRTTKYNKDIGGKSKSFHICDSDVERNQRGCLAVDVAVIEGPYRGDIFSLAWRREWTIGWNAKRGFLHLDQRVMVGWRQTTFDY